MPALVSAPFAPLGRLSRLVNDFYSPSPFPVFEDVLADLHAASSRPIHIDFYEVPKSSEYRKDNIC